MRQILRGSFSAASGLLLFLLFANVSLRAQDGWELKRSDHGIDVYARKLDNDQYKEIRVLCEINTTPEKLVALLQDIPNQKSWSYGVKQGYILNRESAAKFTYWAEIELPWPVSNRDVVVEMTFKKDDVTGIYSVQAQSVPNILPPKKHLIRVPYSLATWKIVPLSADRLKIEYQFSASPGGELPAWLVNMASTTGPYQSFAKLKKLLESRVSGF